MRNYLFLIAAMLGLSACSQSVPAGYVGVKVYLLGGSKGVDHEVLGVGRYYIGYNEELYTFPTFTQNYVWSKSPTEGRPDDESFSFQTKEGLTVNTDVGISYEIDPTKVSLIFQKYRRGLDEITHIFLRNSVRDALNKQASNMTVEDIYGAKKGDLITTAQATVAAEVGAVGIKIDKLYLTGSMRLPENVMAALNSKIEATQKAIQSQNEVVQAKAEAEKAIAIAHGEAEANRQKVLSLSPALIQYEAIQKWNGVLPTMTGSGAIPFINITK